MNVQMKSNNNMKRILFLCLAALSLVGTDAFAQYQTVRAFSHRGGRLENDENTLSAFQKSYEIGYTGFETDIRMTKDGVLIITHDQTLERTTNGTGIVEEKTWEEIHSYDTKGGHKILTLDELMEFLKDKKGLYVEFELKTKPENLYPQERLEAYCDKLYERVMRDKPADAEFVFTSSDYRGLRYLMGKHPEANYLMISSKPVCDETISMAKALGIHRIGCKMPGTSKAMVEKAKKEGLIVSLWPTEKIEHFILGIYLGADFLCTDIPQECMTTIREHFPWCNVIY